MKCSKLFFAAIFGSVLMVSCSDDSTPVNVPLGAYQDGFFVVNEGGSSGGGLSYVKNDFSLVKQDIYGAENDGDGVGIFVQSMFFDGDRAFIIANGSNKITIVNRYTFKLIGKIESGLNVPRYGVVFNGKAYVTNLTSDFNNLTDDYISVINLSTLQIENTIPVNGIAERITEENGKLYVLNGSYGDGNSVTVINPETGTIEKTIDTGLSPTSFEVYNGNLYVLASNYVDPSHLVKIDLATNTAVSNITFPASLVNAQNFNIENDKIYFTVDSKVYEDAVAETFVSDTPLFTSAAASLYGFGVKDNLIYVSDAKNYASDGEIFVYSILGDLQHNETVGLIPNGFYFN